MPSAGRGHLHCPRPRSVGDLHVPELDGPGGVGVLHGPAGAVEGQPEVRSGSIEAQLDQPWREARDAFHGGGETGELEPRAGLHAGGGRAIFRALPPVSFAEQDGPEGSGGKLAQEPRLDRLAAGATARQRRGQRGRVVHHQEISSAQQSRQIADARVAQGSGARVDYQESLARRVLTRPARGDHRASFQAATSRRAPLSMRSAWPIIEAIRRATPAGWSNAARSASGIAAACISVSISPGSTLRKRTPEGDSSADKIRLRWSCAALETP